MAPNRRGPSTRIMTRSAIHDQDALPKVIRVLHDPPQVKLDPPRELTLVGTFELNIPNTANPGTTVPTMIASDTITALANKQLGSNVSRLILVKSVKAWANPTIQGSQTLIPRFSLRDVIRGVCCEDSGTMNHRPGCGLDYPANIRPFVNPSVTSQSLCEIDSPNVGGIYHLNVRVWGLPDTLDTR
jgi:hypothetical protein